MDQGVEGSLGVAFRGVIGLAIFGIAAAVIAIISFGLKIKGVNMAEKDEASESKQYFKNAFVCIIIALACSAGSAILVWIIVITHLIALIAQMIAQYATGALGAVFALILSIIGIVLVVVKYIMYLSILSKAKTAFD